MGLSILERPLGIGLDTCVSATIDEDYVGSATVNTTLPHNLAEDDYVYVTSNVEDYNGFWPIHFIDGFHFFLKNPNGTYVSYIVDAAITYCPELFRHGWSCAHLPIVYKIKSTLFPTNTVDTSRTVTSFTNDNGYVNLNLSGSLGTFEELQFIEISDATTDAVNGVFQVLDKASSSDITIDLSYDATYSFTNGTVILYYSSYHIVVKVYAGLNATHPWVAIKPYELAATLRLIPDSNNEVKFSINEILKAYINIRNNTILATLPNNLDAFTQFYISIAESYDQTDGYTITTYETSFTSDQATFEGVAANSILEFKNQYSGYLTEYIDKFLTLFTTPIAFVGEYFDLSFINRYEGYDLTLRLKKYLNNNLLETENIPYSNPGEGIIRGIFDIDSGYDQYCVQSFFGGSSVLSLTDLTLQTGSGTSWTTGANPSVSTATNSKKLYTVYTVSPGATYTIVMNVVVTNAMLGYVELGFLNNGLSIEASDTGNVFSAGSKTLNFTLVATEGSAYLYLSMTESLGTFVTVSITNVTITVSEAEVTEQLCIDINNECSNQDIYLSWLNNLGGFDYWKFTAYKEYIRDISNTGEVKTNIFPNWPKSYGADANTINKQTFRDSKKKILVQSQHVTLEQLTAIEYIRSSILVEIVNSRTDKRRVIVDSDSWTSYKDNDKLFNISFTIEYTDDIPSQRL